MKQVRSFVAFLIDLSLGHFLFFLTLSFSPVDTLMETILDILRDYKGLIQLINIDLTYLSSLIGIFIFTYLLKFYSNLLFARTAGQFVMSLKSAGGPLWSRIGGSLRELSGVVLTPLVIFDLPLVEGCSIKEKITLSEIQITAKKQHKYFSVPMTIIIFVFSFFGPLFYHMSLVDGLKVSFDKTKKVKLNNQSKFDKFKLYRSNRFMFESFSDMSEGRYSILPSFEIIKGRKSSKINPYIKIYDNQLKATYSLYLGKAYSLLKVLKKASTGNFLFSSKYPLISAAIDDEPLYKRWPAIEGKKVKKLFTLELVKEIQALIESSMELGFSNILSHVINNGPFIRGHVELRNTFLNIVEEGIAPTVDIIKFGNNSFLRFTHYFKDLINVKGAYQETLIPIDTPYSQVIVVTCENCKDNYEGLADFKKRFFGGAQWMFDYQQAKHFPRKESEVDSLAIVDYLNVTSMDFDSRESFEEGIYNHFFDLGKVALSTKDEILQKETIHSLRKTIMVVRIVNAIKKNYYSKKFEKFLDVLTISLSNKNSRFFSTSVTKEEDDEF